MKRTSRGWLIILLVMFALSTFVVMPASATPRTCTHLRVNGFTCEVDQWDKYGAEPWIDSDDGDASYIETSKYHYVQKYFEFEDLPATLGEDKVTLNVKLRDPDGWVTGEKLRCYI